MNKRQFYSKIKLLEDAYEDNSYRGLEDDILKAMAGASASYAVGRFGFAYNHKLIAFGMAMFLMGFRACEDDWSDLEWGGDGNS